MWKQLIGILNSRGFATSLFRSKQASSNEITTNLELVVGFQVGAKLSKYRFRQHSGQIQFILQPFYAMAPEPNFKDLCLIGENDRVVQMLEMARSELGANDQRAW